MAWNISNRYARHKGKGEISEILYFNHRSYPVKNVSWGSWKPTRDVQVTEEGFLSRWRRAGEELALDTRNVQNQ